ncbi:MAG: SDR family oxidoreductase [Firmicutes bacterium]|nr:SDR family oxidoreductase [Dethiobacter sp.]MBS3888070.1 SDR family oxidoreductase [Bacillota bacterium]MBS4053917.1 SDR family oxidoreductase [Thermaerobacter sp.]MBS4055511.1 SDR family oxidoreductase [Thermaerobacter sp.]
MQLQVDLRSQVAVLTGGAGVLCAAMARALAKNGARVAILDLRIEAAAQVAGEIKAEGGLAIGLGVDVLDTQSLKLARDVIIKEFGRVDILINGAGGNMPKATTGAERSFFDLAALDIKKVLDLNFMGTLLPTQVFGEIMVAQKRGSIINISSMAAYTPLTRTIAYSAAKAAVENLTKWLAVHFNQEYSHEIRVNAIAPGFLLTEQNRYLLIDAESGENTARGKAILQATPMARYGEAEDLVGAVLFLCSDAASFINGVSLPIDGAFSAYSGV